MTTVVEEHQIPDSVLLDSVRTDPESKAAREAACTLLSRYRERVYAWCYRKLGDPENALDASQEVLLNAYRNLDKFQGQSGFGSWLYVIARNRCWGEMRRPRLLVDEKTSPDRLQGGEGDPATVYFERRSEEEILALIRAELEPLEQRVLWLRCFERMSIDRITDALEIEEASGARGVLQRARRRLRAAMLRRGLITEYSR